MENIISQLNEKKIFFESLIQKTKVALKKSPDEGHLRVGRPKGKPQYFQMTQKGDTNGRYLCQKRPELKALTMRLAQRDYNLRLLKNCEAWEKAINLFLKAAPGECPEEIFTNCPARRDLIKPAVLSDSEFIKNWQNAPFKGKTFDSTDIGFLTNRGERVRSKSEKIIADRLNFLGIPYRYEAPVKLKMSVRTILLHPDFTILNKRTRKEIIFEHFGLADDPEYAVSMVKKINLYLLNGYVLGDTLIFSQETDTVPLDTRVLDKMLAPLCG